MNKPALLLIRYLDGKNMISAISRFFKSFRLNCDDFIAKAYMIIKYK